MALSGDDILLVERVHRHAIVTINREERANALSLELIERLAATWQELRDDDEVLAVILTGAGTRYFSSGNDLKDTAALDATSTGGFVGALQERDVRITPADHGFWKPIIAAVNGAAFAGGFYLAQMCDVRLAADTATFTISEVRWSLGAPFVAELQRMIPPAVARELAFWGTRRVSAQRMYEVGFVNDVLPGDQLLDEATRWAIQVSEMAPLAVQAHKQLMHRSLELDRASVDAMAAELLDPIMVSEDAVEGPLAFAEGRPPVWKLR